MGNREISTSGFLSALPVLQLLMVRTALVALLAAGTGSIAAAAPDSAASKASPVDGFWLGTLPGAQPLRIQLVVTNEGQGQEHCSLDSIDQGSFNIACTNVVYSGRQLNFDVPAVHGHWAGELSADQNTLTGNWKQGDPTPVPAAVSGIDALKDVSDQIGKLDALREVSGPPGCRRPHGRCFIAIFCWRAGGRASPP